jgi:hypothetical protein
MSAEDIRGLKTPNGEEAVERCPVCGRLNSPGACDTCEHFYGSAWDGDLIWNDFFETEMGKPWDALVEFIRELSEAKDKGGIEKAKLLAKKLSIPAKWLKLARREVGAFSAMKELVKFQVGLRVVTDGMLSGEGYSLYLEDPGVVENLGKNFARLVNKLKPRRRGTR